MHDVYEQLAFHLSTLGMGLPYREELLEILRTDRTDHSPLPDFVQLHGEILKEKGLV